MKTSVSSLLAVFYLVPVTHKGARGRWRRSKGGQGDWIFFFLFFLSLRTTLRAEWRPDERADKQTVKLGAGRLLRGEPCERRDGSLLFLELEQQQQ